MRSKPPSSSSRVDWCASWVGGGAKGAAEEVIQFDNTSHSDCAKFAAHTV